MKIHCKKKFLLNANIRINQSLLLLNDLLTWCIRNDPICDDYQACTLGKVELITAFST